MNGRTAAAAVVLLVVVGGLAATTVGGPAGLWAIPAVVATAAAVATGVQVRSEGGPAWRATAVYAAVAGASVLMVVVAT